MDKLEPPTISFCMVSLMSEWVIYNEQPSWALKTILFKFLKFIFLVNRPPDYYPYYNHKKRKHIDILYFLSSPLFHKYFSINFFPTRIISESYWRNLSQQDLTVYEHNYIKVSVLRK